MKILKKYIDRKRKGRVTLIPESTEDFWYLYNIIKIGDIVKLKINRKVQNESATGFVRTSKRYVLAILEVLDVEFSFDNSGTSLFFKTRNVGKSDFIEMGQLQTAQISLFYPLTIIKNYWDKISFSYLDESKKAAATSDIAAILIQDGSANTFYIKSNFSMHNNKIEKSLPRKKTSLMTFYNKALQEFYDKCLSGILNQFDLEEIKCFVVAGPGTTPGLFMDFLKKKAEQKVNRKLRDNMKKFFVVHASSASGNALNEILEDPTLQKRISNTKAIEENGMLNEFFDMMRLNPARAIYGEREVFYGQDMAAIEHLLIVDSMFRSHDFKARRKFIRLTDKVKSTGGTVHILSDMHPSGRKLKDITGIAAICRFGVDLDILDQMAEADEEERLKTEMKKKGIEDPALRELPIIDDDGMDNDVFDEYELYTNDDN